MVEAEIGVPLLQTRGAWGTGARRDKNPSLEGSEGDGLLMP